MPEELRAASAAVDLAQTVVDSAARALAEQSSENGKVSVARLDENQVVAYDLAHAAAAVEGSRVMCGYGEHGEVESMLGAPTSPTRCTMSRPRARSEPVMERRARRPRRAMPFVSEHRAPAFLESLADQCVKHGSGPTHLSEDFELVAETFRRFADDKIRPAAEHVHRTNADVPEDIISGLAELGGFGLSVPEEYGGFATGGESDYMGMVVATEELSRGSLGIGGSLVTRPEILTRALVAGGTEEQKQTWLPRIASGELMVGIMVTEPDYGSDVAGVKVTATPTDGGWLVNGVKTWATFAGRADVLMLLARTDPDRSAGHRGLSILIVEKPRAEGHAFAFDDGRGGKAEGRAIDTIGYRGMHSYEVAFDNLFVPGTHLIGGEAGHGPRLLPPDGRLRERPAADRGARRRPDAGRVRSRALVRAGAQGVRRAGVRLPAVEGEARAHGRAHPGRPPVLLRRRRERWRGEGTLEASMVKAYVCRAAEWVTREAMQLHGGMGYAEEFPVSRFFVDARVLSIFEGADETLCLPRASPRRR